MYKLINNRLFRIFISFLLVAVFFVVPIEHKMLVAEASFTAAMAISVICAVLVAMGFTFGRVFINENIDKQFAKYSIADTVASMKELALDIYNNCPNIDVAIGTCFPGGGLGYPATKQIVQISAYLYQIIKKYIMEKFGDKADKVEEALNSGSYGVKGNPFAYNGYYFYKHDPDLYRNYSGYGEMSFSGYHFYFNFVNLSGTTYEYECKYEVPPYDQNYSYNKMYTYKPNSLSVVGTYTSIYSPNSRYPYGSFDAYINYRCVNIYNGEEVGSYFSTRLAFDSDASYQAALKAYGGEVDPAVIEETKKIDVDKNQFDATKISDLPKYVYIYENIEDYVGKTAVDIAAPAYDELVDSNVVDNTSRTVTWQGDRTLCPIDELQGSLPTAVIGHWVATWDEVGTLCDITCYAEDGSVAWSGEIATTLTWADVLAKLGDISITGSIAGSVAGAAVGSLAAPDLALDFEPLKFAGETFSKKFPFCLPFDLYRGFKQLDVDEEAKAPVFVLPLNMGALGDHSVEIDFSRFDKQAAIVKWFLYVLFVINLIVITKKVLGGGS